MTVLMSRAMGVLRRRVGWLVGAWLVCQLASVATASVSVVRTLGGATVAADAEECNCPDVEPGATCPMHHTTRHGVPAKPVCRMCGTTASPDATLVVLTLGLGGPTAVAGTHDPSSPSVPVITTDQSTRSRSARPDAPPPRA